MAQVVRVLDLGQQQAGAFRALVRSGAPRTRTTAEDVVGQHDDSGVVADELCRQAQGLGDAAGPLLVGVKEALHAELLAVGQEPEELARVRAARHDHDLGDARLDERLDPVADHRPVADRQQVLVGDAGEGMKPAARAAGEDDASHGST